MARPTELLIIPDHYVFRMLYSQGVPLEALGIPAADGGPVEHDHRKIWQTFADHFYLFRGTPSGLWLAHELARSLAIESKLNGATAQEIYDQIGGQAGHAGISPPRPVRAFQHRGAVHHRRGHRLAGHTTRRSATRAGRAMCAPPFAPTRWSTSCRPGWRADMDALSEVSRRSTSTLTRPTSRPWSSGAPFSSRDGRHGHRPRGRDGLHRRADARRGGRDVPARPARRGHARGRRAALRRT